VNKYSWGIIMFPWQFVDRIALVAMPKKYQPDHMYLRHVPIKRVHLFTLFQILSLGVLWVVKMIKSISILFPIMVCKLHPANCQVQGSMLLKKLRFMADTCNHHERYICACRSWVLALWENCSSTSLLNENWNGWMIWCLKTRKWLRRTKKRQTKSRFVIIIERQCKCYF
jgi:hypothetical protein